MVIEMPNYKPHTIGNKERLIDECMKYFINAWTRDELIKMDNDEFNGYVMKWFCFRTTYSPKYVKDNYTFIIRNRLTKADF